MFGFNLIKFSLTDDKSDKKHDVYDHFSDGQVHVHNSVILVQSNLSGRPFHWKPNLCASVFFALISRLLGDEVK